MAIESAYTPARTVGGGLTDFDFTFPFFSPSDILVYTIDTSTTPETATLKTLMTDYSLLDADGSAIAQDGFYEGGTVRFTAAVSGLDVFIGRDIAFTQPTDFPTAGLLREQSIERALDRLALQIQQVDNAITRSLLLPVTSETGDLELPEPTADTYLGWDAAGTALENKTLADLDVLVKATEAEVVTGTDDDKYVTPLGVKAATDALDTSLSADITAATDALDTSLSADITAVQNARLASGYSNLVVKNNAVNSGHQLDIDADYIEVDEYLLDGVNLTVDVSASGANGLDTGSEANSTWYYAWVIYNPTTSTTAGLLSASATAPTLPSGYTKKRLVSAVRNDGSGDFLEFIQIGSEVALNEALAPTLVLNGGTETAYTDVDCTGVIPAALVSSVRVIAYGNGDAAETKVYLRPNGAANIDGPVAVSSGSAIACEHEVLTTDGIIEYHMDSDDLAVSVNVVGYRLGRVL